MLWVDKRFLIVLALWVGALSSVGAWYPREFPRIGLNRWLELDDEVRTGGGIWRADFENMTKDYLNIVDQGRVYVVSSQITGLAFDCNATYPILWIANHNDDSEYYSFYTRVRYMRSNPDVFNPRSNLFTAQLDFYGEQSGISGNYSCISSEYPHEVTKSIYVYWQGTNPSNLINGGRSLEVQSKDGHYLILPCRVSRPDVIVNLFREVNSEWVPVKSPFIKFNPKYGFRINILQYNGAYGRFKCSVNDEDDEAVIINIKKGVKEGAEFNDTMDGKASLTYNRTSQEIVCCSNSTKSPKLHTLFCVESFSCELRKSQLLTIVNNGKRFQNGSCTTERIYNKDSGILRCLGDGIDITRNFYTDLPTPKNNRTTNLVFNWKDITRDQMADISVTARGPLYNKQNVTIACDTAFNYFAEGMQWAIRWKNGSLRFIPTAVSRSIVGHGDVYETSVVSYLSIRLQLNMNMSEIICYAPIRNSTDWVNKTLTLDIHETQKPVFENPDIEMIQWTLNATDKVLECRVTGAPVPTIRWKKNNRTILPESNIAMKRQNGTASLVVHRVSHDTQGEYRCIASNFGGSSHKVFKVFIEEPGSPLGIVGLSILIVLVVLLVGGMGFLIWKMQLQRNIITHLAGIVFRDVNTSNSNNNGDAANGNATRGNSDINPFPSSVG